MTEEHKRKIGTANTIALRGNKNHLGHKATKEQREKMRMAHLGKKQSKEHIEKRVRQLRGRKYTFSEERKQNISKALTGRNLSDRHRQRLKETSPHLSGTRHPNWQGGISLLTQRIRHSFRYRQWRSDIFTRDDFTCVLCNKRGGSLVADHSPKYFSEIFHNNKIETLEQAIDCEEFWNINNGRTLCRKCHSKFPTIKTSNNQKL